MAEDVSDAEREVRSRTQGGVVVTDYTDVLSGVYTAVVVEESAGVTLYDKIVVIDELVIKSPGGRGKIYTVKGVTKVTLYLELREPLRSKNIRIKALSWEEILQRGLITR